MTVVIERALVRAVDLLVHMRHYRPFAQRARGLVQDLINASAANIRDLGQLVAAEGFLGIPGHSLGDIKRARVLAKSLDPQQYSIVVVGYPACGVDIVIFTPDVGTRAWHLIAVTAHARSPVLARALVGLRELCGLLRVSFE